MTTLCDKYKAVCFSDIKGQEIAVIRIKNFLKDFPRKKALILQGPTGTGKTSLAYALASENKAEILELNASDLRDKESIKNIIGEASKQQGLYQKNKILLVDEIDGITKDDYGGLQELINVIQETNFPIIITSNNIWDRKFSELRRKAELIELKELKYDVILSILEEITKKENLSLQKDILKSIAIKARGDVRAALNDLQSISKETSHEDIHERDKEENIFTILKQVLKELPNHKTLSLYDNVNMSLDDILLWLEENVPSEYKGQELYKAFEALSKADVFRGRIHRQQHWRFLVYQNFFLSAAIASAKNNAKLGFTFYKKPSRILKIWLINQKQKHKKSISEKYAEYCHIGTKRAMKDFPIIKQIINQPEIQKDLKLTAEEIEFLRS